MDEIEFANLVNKKRYQIFLFSSKLPFPFNFAVHTWIVSNKKGRINRWEVWQFKNMKKDSQGHINRNLFSHSIGLKRFILGKKRWESVLLFKIEGLIAEKMIKFIEKEYSNYPYRNRYLYVPGPNSNTFIQWILDKFPKSGLILPKNAIGKNYKI